MEYEPTKEEIEHARFYMTIESWDRKRHKHHNYPYWHSVDIFHDSCRKQNFELRYLSDWEIIGELRRIHWEKERFKKLQQTEGN